MTNFHVYAGAEGAPAYPDVRSIEIGDLYDCLRAGYEDFMAKPSHIIFLIVMYPLIGVVLAAWTSGANALPMLFPLASGFALLGPFAAIGLYEISRRREAGMDTSWRHALELRHSPALPSIAAVGAMLFAVFIAWLLTAQALYSAIFGPEPPASFGNFLSQLFSTSEGWTLILAGNAIGFVFAVVVLSTTVVAFPLLVDRDVGAWAAIYTSARAVMANPLQMLAWGFIVALLLALGSLPLFAGLIVVIPILGHATWHLYRKVVVEERG
ncbi:DUF2189 domain-containing protein [Neoaquamicrobium sediminum]|uniref:DUF2189 domain-containing protein n=1 Tax=Neoaquamicrobium sediminum TaxID=1849104 RepID=A0ABV3WWY8_9HYPH